MKVTHDLISNKSIPINLIIIIQYYEGRHRCSRSHRRRRCRRHLQTDGYSGYVADVKYEGEAKAYDYKPAYKSTYQPEYKNVEPTY